MYQKTKSILWGKKPTKIKQAIVINKTLPLSNNLVPKIVISSNSKTALIDYLQKLKFSSLYSTINYFSVVSPVTKKRITLLKSPHVNKKAKEHFEINTYKQVFYFKKTEEMYLLRNFLINKPSCIQVKLFFKV